MNVSRRGFLKLGAAALAACAVSKLPDYPELPITDRERLARLLLQDGAVISDQYFIFHDPHPLELTGLKNTYFIRCYFIWTCPADETNPYLLTVSESCENISFDECIFERPPPDGITSCQLLRFHS
jgi:hypothetical protein